MKKILYSIILITASVAASAQVRNTDKKWENNFMMHIHHNKSSIDFNQKLSLKLILTGQEVNKQSH